MSCFCRRCQSSHNIITCLSCRFVSDRTKAITDRCNRTEWRRSLILAFLLLSTIMSVVSSSYVCSIQSSRSYRVVVLVRGHLVRLPFIRVLSPFRAGKTTRKGPLVFFVVHVVDSSSRLGMPSFTRRNWIHSRIWCPIMWIMMHQTHVPYTILKHTTKKGECVCVHTGPIVFRIRFAFCVRFSGAYEHKYC